MLITPQTAAHGDGQQDEAGLELEGLLGDGVFERALDVLHAFEGNELLAAVAVGILKAGVKFQAAGLIDSKERAALGLDAAVKEIKDFLLRPVFGIEKMVELLGAAHLDDLGDHDRPGDDGEDDEAEDDAFAFGRGLAPDVNQIGLAGSSRCCR